MNRYTIIYPPTVSWQEVIFQRPQQLLSEFARQGHFALFTNRVMDDKGSYWYADTNLVIVNDLTATLNAGEIRAKMAGTRIILWVSYPPTLWLKSSVRPDLTVFDYIDESIEEFAFWQEGLTGAMELADIITVTSEKLFRITEATYPQKTFLLRNGVNFMHFAQPIRGVPADLNKIKKQYKRVIGFHGNLESWIDYGLIREVALARPQWAFVLIGPENHVDEQCRGIANIYFLGGREYPLLPTYVRNFDVGIIPFQVREMTQSANPIKMYEYLAAGIPVVATPIHECVNLSPLVKVAQTPVQFIEQLEWAIRAKPREKEAYVRLAFRNSWEERVKLALMILDGVHMRKG